MNTKTMRLPPRRVLTPNKRKEREGTDTLKPSAPIKLHELAAPQAKPSSPKPSPEPLASNQLLAGYLAHEYLTKGTLFGQPWDPTTQSHSGEKSEANPSQEAKAEAEAEARREADYKSSLDSYICERVYKLRSFHQVLRSHWQAIASTEAIERKEKDLA